MFLNIFNSKLILQVNRSLVDVTISKNGGENMLKNTTNNVFRVFVNSNIY